MTMAALNISVIKAACVAKRKWRIGAHQRAATLSAANAGIAAAHGVAK